MAEKDNLGITKFLLVFVVVILAVAFLTSISDQTNTVTSKTSVSDESYDLSTLGCLTEDGQVNESSSACNLTVTNAPTGWKSVDCPLTNVVVGNDTTTLTLDTDYYLFASTGVLQLLNTTETENGTIGNDVYVDYTYCGDGYVNSSWGRNILGVNAGLFAVAILIIVVALVYMYLKNKED